MPSTYQAVLTGDTLAWSDEVPELVVTRQPVRVQVTILDEPPDSSQEQARGQRMAAALERVAATGGVASITDPRAWQCEIREDRDLPGQDA